MVGGASEQSGRPQSEGGWLAVRWKGALSMRSCRLLRQRSLCASEGLVLLWEIPGLWLVEEKD